MPAGNRMGPMGFGPRTGRGAGYCSGYPQPGYMNSSWGAAGGGAAGGWGRGFRHRRWFYATGVPGWMRGYGPGWPVPERSSEEEAEFLEQQASSLKEQLGAIETRLAEVRGAGEE